MTSASMVLRQYVGGVQQALRANLVDVAAGRFSATGQPNAPNADFRYGICPVMKRASRPALPAALATTILMATPASALVPLDLEGTWDSTAA